MNFLQKLAGGIDTTQALHSLLRQPELWVDNVVTLRHFAEGKWQNWFSLDLLPHFRQFTFGILARIEGEELGGVEIVKVPPGEDWTSGASGGMDYYFLSINVAPGVSVASHAEGVMLAPGDVWWVKDEAKFVNNSADDFILLAVVARPSSPGTYLPEAS